MKEEIISQEFRFKNTEEIKNDQKKKKNQKTKKNWWVRSAKILLQF